MPILPSCLFIANELSPMIVINRTHLTAIIDDVVNHMPGDRIEIDLPQLQTGGGETFRNLAISRCLFLVSLRPMALTFLTQPLVPLIKKAHGTGLPTATIAT